MALRIVVNYRGAESVREFSADKVMIGRADGEQVPDLDLSVDPCVSRQHALVEIKEGVCWLTDLGSRLGTQVNGREIRAQGEWRLWPEDTVLMGETILRFSAAKPKAPIPARPAARPASHSAPPAPRPAKAPPIADAAPPVSATPAAPGPSPRPGTGAAKEHFRPAVQTPAVSEPAVTSPGPESVDEVLVAAPAQSAPGDVRVLQMIDTDKHLAPGEQSEARVPASRAESLQALAMELAGPATQDELLQTVMERVVGALPAARRGALVLRDPKNDSLLLKAYVSADEPALSQTLARRAMRERRGFIWRSGDNIDPTRSIAEFHIVTGLYAPVQWRDEVYGVICVDSPVATDTFDEADLRFLIATGQYAGMALAEQQQRSELRRTGELLDRLMANFSPKLRALLLDQARQGKLRPGGVKSEVTLLFFDLCGFTKRAAALDSHDVVEMLNHYFGRLLETIFLYDGTVDKFLGDGVLALFGSPEPDPQQHQKAIRAAVALQQAMAVVSQQRAARGEAACQVRLGLHCGEVFHGFLGAVDRLEYTVIGDAVNRASRYCQAAGEGEIVISRDLYQHVFNLVKADKITIATKEGELGAYRLTALKG